MSKLAVALFYQPEAYSTSGSRLMGRNAAGESFFKGLLKHSKTLELYAYLTNEDHRVPLQEMQMQLQSEQKIAGFFASDLSEKKIVDLLYYPAPNISEQLWFRSVHGHSRWSVCGVTHTTSSAVVMDGIAELVTSPVAPWDAVICTSEAVKRNVLSILEAQEEFLAHRLGATKFIRPQFPVIPLGVHPNDFSFGPSERARARDQLGIAADTIVVLFMGRLSFHAKAHPAAMYKAIQEAGRKAQKKVVLLECGWHANAHIRDAFIAAAQTLCPEVTVMILDGRNAAHRELAWSSSDVFCSLSDNIQETFGITPLEAMAAGIPVVVSDWDGYKESVRHGVDGFRIPTQFPRQGLGEEIATRHALQVDSYDIYCGNVCMTTAVDIQAATGAFERLFSSTTLRQAMGAAGRRRVDELYDWTRVIPQYEALWEELNERRRVDGSQAEKQAARWPARLNPYDAFEHYPTSLIDGVTRFEPSMEDETELLRNIYRERALAMNNFARFILPSELMIQQIISNIFSGNRCARDIATQLPYSEKQTVNAIAWLLKLGFLRLTTE